MLIVSDFLTNFPGNPVHKINDLNAPAEESGDDEDDIDWEDG